MAGAPASKVLLWAAATLGAAALPVHAAEWSWTPNVRWSLDYDSNRGLNDAGLAGESTELQLGSLVAVATERTRLDLHSQVATQRFADGGIPDAERLSFDLHASHVATRDSLRLHARARRQNTLFSEIDDSGVIDLDSDRTDLEAEAAWVRQFGQRFETRATIGITDADFSGPLTTRLTGYRYPYGSLVTAWRFSERTSGSLIGSYGRLDSGSLLLRSRTTALQVGLNHRLSDRAVLAIEGGASESRSLGGDRSGYVGRVSWNLELPRGAISLAVGRALRPSGFGVLVRRSDASVEARYAVGPRTSATVALASVHNDDFGLLRSGERRRYARFDTALSHRVTESWAVNLLLGAGRADDFDATGSADGMRAAVSLSWAPPARAVSR